MYCTPSTMLPNTVPWPWSCPNADCRGFSRKNSGTAAPTAAADTQNTIAGANPFSSHPAPNGPNSCAPLNTIEDNANAVRDVLWRHQAGHHGRPRGERQGEIDAVDQRQDHQVRDRHRVRRDQHRQDDQADQVDELRDDQIAFRLNRSAMTPPKIESTSDGNCEEAATAVTRNGDPVMSKTSHPWR